MFEKHIIEDLCLLFVVIAREHVGRHVGTQSTQGT